MHYIQHLTRLTRFNQVLPVARAASIQREMHMRESHPYAPFPVARLEAAVAAVPLEAYEPAERSMTTFGRAFRFRCRSLPFASLLAWQASRNVRARPWLPAG